MFKKSLVILSLSSVIFLGCSSKQEKSLEIEKAKIQIQKPVVKEQKIIEPIVKVQEEITPKAQPIITKKREFGVNKKSCIIQSDYLGKTLDEQKNILVKKAKNEALNELYGQLIYSKADVQNGKLVSEEIRQRAIGKVRVNGNPRYFNGENFGEICVDLNAYVLKEDLEKYAPKEVTLNKYCFNDTRVAINQVKQQAKYSAYKEILSRYKPSLNVSNEQAQKLIHGFIMSNERFDFDTSSYCFDAKAKVLPYELEMIEGGEKLNTPIKKLETHTNTSSDNFEFDLRADKYEIGDTLDEYGENIVVRGDKANKYFKLNDGYIKIKDLKLAGNFDVSVNLDIYRSTVNFSLLSDNQKAIKASVSRDYTKFGSRYEKYSFSAKYYTNFRFIKTHDTVRFYINGILFNKIKVNPNSSYNSLLIEGVHKYATLYDISVRTNNFINKGKDKFNLNVNDYEVTDSYGSLEVFKSSKGSKYLGSRSNNGILEIKNLHLKDKFRIKFKKYEYSQTQLLSLSSKNNPTIFLSFIYKNVNFGLDYKKHDASTKEILLEKKNDKIKLYINGKFFSYARVPKDIVISRINLTGIKKGDALYDFKIE